MNKNATLTNREAKKLDTALCNAIGAGKFAVLKNYFVTLEVRDGESEYHQYGLVEAKTLDGAEKEAKKILQKKWNLSYDREENYFQGQNDYRIYSIDGIDEIGGEAELTALKKHFYHL